MIPTKSEIDALHRKYAANDLLYTLVYQHCQIVAEVALWCADRTPPEAKMKVNRQLLEVAALLHDIGSYGFMTETEGRVANHRTYAQHALLGAEILRGEGVDERISQIVKTHIQMGLSKEEIISQNIGLPPRDLTPKSIEAEILCYADRFHSKKPKFNAYDTYIVFLQKIFPTQVEKFRAAAKKFGVPDLQALSKKYDHPVA